MTRFSFLLFVLGLSAALVRVSAQTTTATILGTITDSSGASVANANITVRQVGTGLTRSVTSDDSGGYFVPQLPVGDYEVTVERSGFKKAVVSGVTAAVDQKSRVDVSLTVGQIVETVEVTTQAPLIKTDSADVGMVVDNKRVTEMPLNGRIYYHLNLLDSGTAQRSGWRTSIWQPVGGANFSFNGSSSDSNQYLVDGIMSQEVTVTHPTMKVTIDAIQEFKQQASQYSAEFGHGGGAQINLVTKSGTNQIHGSAWEFLRNDFFDARNYFDPTREARQAQGLSPIPEFKQNQFGATIGGPIRRDRTFFFGSYEGTRIRKSITRLFSVPPVDQRGGVFPASPLIYDPRTTRPDPVVPGRTLRDPFPGNRIPSDQVDPIARTVLDRMFPLPSGAGVSANLSASPTQSTNEDQFLIRVDHHVSTKDTIYGRFSYVQPRRVLPLTFSQLPNFADVWNQPARNAVLNYTRIFSPNTLNEFKIGYNRFTQFLRDFDEARDVPAELGIRRLDSRFGGNPTINITGFNRTAGITNSPNDRSDNVYQLVDNFTIVKGNHAMGAGVNIRHIQNNGGVQPNPRGIFTFTARYTALPGVANTGSPMADYLLGYPTQTQGGTGDGFRNARHNEFAGYWKDDWRISPKLTLNLGLRYEYYGPWYEVHDRLTFFDFATGQVVSTAEIQKRGYPAASYEADKLDFAPRFGFAYRPFGNNKTVLRGGYGIFHSFGQGYSLVVSGNPSPETRSYTFNADAITPNLTLANGFPLALASESYSAWAWQTKWTSPYNQQWSFNVQREIVANWVIEVGYLGNKGSHLLGVKDIDRPAPGTGSIVSRRPYPAFTSVSFMGPFGNSTYHSLKVTGERRVTANLSFRASWTFAKNLNVGGMGSFGESTETIRRDPNNPAAEKGRSLYDARNRFTLSYNYEFPFGKGKKFLSNANGVVGGIVGGWQINGITILQTGTPVDTSLAVDSSNTGGAGGDNRPDRIGDPDKGAPKKVEQFFRTDAFAVPGALSWGNAGKNIITGPGITNFDCSLFKTFSLSETQKLQFRFEVFNLFNHPNFDLPNAQFGTANFGKIFSAGEARELQFALRYRF